VPVKPQSAMRRQPKLKNPKTLKIKRPRQLKRSHLKKKEAAGEIIVTKGVSEKIIVTSVTGANSANSAISGISGTVAISGTVVISAIREINGIPAAISGIREINGIPAAISGIREINGIPAAIIVTSATETHKRSPRSAGRWTNMILKG